jgi:hypothetical protein
MEDHIYQWGKKHKNQWGSYMFDDFFECPKNICEKILQVGSLHSCSLSPGSGEASRGAGLYHGLRIVTPKKRASIYMMYNLYMISN